MEENKTLEMAEMAVEEMAEYYEPTSKKGVAIGLGLAAVGGLGLLAYKCRDKIEDLRVKRLEKKGYVVYRPEELTPDPAYTEDCGPTETIEM